jgi:hypothetical protein
MPRLLPAASLACLLGLHPAAALAQASVEVRRAVDAVDQASATRVVQELVAFGTRYTGTTGCDASAQWIFDELAALGYAPVFEDFTWGADTLRNVSARKVGLVRPGETWLLVAHYDSTSTAPAVDAPGADDNASGVAAVLEAARALAPLRHEATIEFLLTAGEEQGLLGSAHDAQAALDAGETIAGVINHDMIAYWPTGWARDLDVNGDVDGFFLAQAYESAAGAHVPGVPVDARDDWGVCGDDQVSYAVRGFPAIIVMDCREAHLGQDGETTPHYHRTSDTIATLDLPRMTEVIRATTATAATLAVPIVRALLRDESRDGPGPAGAVLREGDPAGGALTRLDPDAAATVVEWNPASPFVLSGAGEPLGPGAPGAFAFYETDRDERLHLAREDADGDGALDLVLSFGP